MRRVVLVIATLASALFALRLTVACLDITPIVVEREVSEAETECFACLEDPMACGAIIDACYADPRCAPVYACIEKERCLDRPILDDKLLCGLPCAADAGITRIEDPIVDTYLVGLLACAKAKCEAACDLTDASIGL
jgi:hypothetical protein